MKKTIIPIFFLLASCTSDPSPFGEQIGNTRTYAPDQQGMSFALDSTMTEDTESVIFETQEWDVEESDVDL